MEFSQTVLLNLIHQIYMAGNINKGFLAARFQTEATFGSKELEALKKRIPRLMCPNFRSYDNNHLPRKARKILTDYKKTKDTLETLDLMLAFFIGGTSSR